MNKTAEVVVIGGGIIGCAISYYLAKRGVSVICLEGADHFGNVVLFHIFGHIEPYHCVLIAEHRLRQRFAKLRFTYAGRSEEYKRAYRSVGVFESHSASADSFCYCAYGFILTNDSAVHFVFHVKQSFAFRLSELNYRNVRPFGNYRRNIFGGYNAFHLAVFSAPGIFLFLKLFAKLLFFITKLCRFFKILRIDRR